MKKETRGGKRNGSGAKLKYGEKAKGIGILVPISKELEIRDKIENLLNFYKKVDNNKNKQK